MDMVRLPMLRSPLCLFLALCLAGCGCGNGKDGAEDCSNAEDDDGDGYTDCADPQCASQCVEDCTNGEDDDGDGQVDCADASCSAGCEEDCLNGADDNGDLLEDCADPNCASVCDADGDGFLGSQAGGDDCDDGEASAFPGADEIWYDDVDNDCDPATEDDDQDGDGFDGNAAGSGVDCNDANAASYPGAPETCGDRELNDCDGGAATRSDCFGERSLATADWMIDGFEADSASGWSVAGSEDTNFDGSAELMIGATGHASPAVNAGAIYLVEGPGPPPEGYPRDPLPRITNLSTVPCEMEGLGEEDYAGWSVASVGDLDGDGRPNFAMGARYQDLATYDRVGAIYITSDKCSPGPLGQTAFEIQGGNFWELGTSVARGGDVNGDGFDDLLVGAPRAAPPTSTGAALVFTGRINSDSAAADAYLMAYGEEEEARVGEAVSSPGDLDGDGRDDVAIGSPLSRFNGPDSGRVYIVNDVQPGEFSLQDTLYFALGDADDQLGAMIVSASGDITGDGLADLVVGAPGDVYAPGRVYVIDQVFPTVRVAAAIEGAAPYDGFGASGALLPDVDGDGLPDLAIGAPRDDTQGEDAGVVYLFFGTFDGSRSAVDADASLYGEAAFDFAGTSVAAAADQDADGFVDLIVGAPFHDGIAPGSGRSYVVTFGF